MKRIISLALVLILMAVALVGCGGKAEGKYVVSKVDGQDVKEVLSLYSSMGLGDMSAEDFMSLELKSGGKFTLTAMGESQEGEWKQSGDKITLTIAGQSQECTLKGNELTMSESGSSVVLVKK